MTDPPLHPTPDDSASADQPGGRDAGPLPGALPGVRPKPRRSLWRRLLKWTLLIAITLLLLGAVGWSTFGYVTARQLEAEIEKIREAGEPVSFSDLIEEFGHDGAGRYYAAAFELGIDDPDGVVDRVTEAIYTREPIDDDLMAAGRRMLDRNALYFELLDRAAAVDACRFDLGIHRELMVNPLMNVRRAAHALICRVLVEQDRHDLELAIGQIVSLIRLRRVLLEQRVLIVHLIDRAIADNTAQLITHILQASQPTESQLLRIAEAMAAAEPADLLLRTMLAERVYSIDMMGGPGPKPTILRDDGSQRVGLWPSSWWQAPLWPQWRHMLVGSLRDQAAMVDAARRPMPNAMEAIRAVEPKSQLGGILLSSAIRTFEREQTTQARIRAARLCLLIEAYRERHARLPHQLEDLTPDFIDSIPPDPYSGDPPLYRTDTDAFTVYCLGPNARDDGGSIDSPSDPGEPLDIGYRIELSPERAQSR